MAVESQSKGSGRKTHDSGFRCGVMLALACLAVAGCASLVVTDTKPLPAARLLPPGSETISGAGYRLSDLPPSKATPDLLVVVAMSGGGKRSAAFSYGALEGMRDLPVTTAMGPRPLLGETDGITGVSGGSFTAAYYGLYRDRTFTNYLNDFLYQDTESYIYGVYLLPWHWTWLVDPTVGTNDFMDRVYDRTLFHGATFNDLQARGRPLIAIGATDISYGTPFAFTQESFDLICSDISSFPLSRAVAASNGFPGLFSPVTLTNHAADCGGRTPGWLRRVTPAQKEEPLSRLGDQSRSAERYLNPQMTKYLHLSDGGVSDNLALRTSGAAMQGAAQGGQGLAAGHIDQVRRILVLSIDGEGGQDSTVAQKRLVGGVFSLFGLVSGAQIDRYNFETLMAVGQQTQDFASSIARARCAEGPVINGYPCGDVKGALIHISLVQTPEGPAKERLLAIPTGLTLKHDDVDALVAAGRTAVLNSAPLRSFLDGYEKQPAPGQTTKSPLRRLVSN
jgi:NTE family protein